MVSGGGKGIDSGPALAELRAVLAEGRGSVMLAVDGPAGPHRKVAGLLLPRIRFLSSLRFARASPEAIEAACCIVATSLSHCDVLL